MGAYDLVLIAMRDNIFVVFSFFNQEVLGSGRLIPVSIVLMYKTLSLEQKQ